MTSPTPTLPTSAHRARFSARVPRRHVPLGQQLVQAGILSPADVESALAQLKGKNVKFGELLLQLGLVDEDTLLQFLGRQMDVPSVRLRDGVIDPLVVQLVPHETAQELGSIALFKVRGTLTVAMTDPLNLAHIDELERVTGLTISPVLALESAITTFLPRCYERDFTVDAVTADLDRDSVQVDAERETIDLGDPDLLAEGSPIVNLVNYIIVHAARMRASDIHIEPSQNSATVRFRIDGALREILNPRREFLAPLVSRIKVMAKLDIAEQRLPQDGRIHVAVEGRNIDLRVSTLPTIHGEKVVIRVLDRKNVTFDLNRLGIPDEMLLPLKQLLNRPHGLLLVTGPTGSGKTTTLYSALELIKSVQRNIVTVEDPVEYQVEQVNQVAVNPTKGMTFASALRSILRQDPDVIMIGEIRDAETAAVAVQAALTGHLVLSTLHTNDSAGAVTRLIDMGVESYKLSAALIGVVAQRLARTNCPHCQRPYYPDASLMNMIRYQGPPHRAFTRGEGCRECLDTGFRGRVGLYELLSMSPELRKLVGEQPDLDRIRELSLQQGGTRLMDEGIRLAERGQTSLEEIVRVAYVE